MVLCQFSLSLYLFFSSSLPFPEGIRTNLKVQGCMAQPGCNLLNGTTAVGTLDMSENCGLQLGESETKADVQDKMTLVNH